jgi:type VI secretion system protein ImpJ
MSSNKRVIWSEGLFLRPQHFQQQDRYFERYLELRAGHLRSNAWGFTSLEFETSLLTIGKLALTRASGVFPDGTPFSMPDDDSLPQAIEVAATVRNKTVFLALPLRKAGATEFAGSRAGTLSRYAPSEIDARDTAGDGAVTATIGVGDLATCLSLEGEPTAAFATIPVTQIVECRADRTIVLDRGFMPTVLRVQPAAVLAAFVDELRGLLHQRGEELALRAVASGRGGAAEIQDFLFLQVCNRYEPILAHLASSLNIHPEDFYTLALGIAGEVATFTSLKTRRPPAFRSYEHDRLRESFEPLIASLRESFGTVPTRIAESIPLRVRADIGMWYGVIADKSLIDTASFVLAVRADVPTEQLRRYFPGQSKIATVEQIRRYIVEQTKGVPITALPVAPRQIPFHSGHVYFELDTGDAKWKELRTAGGIAVHVAGQYPGIAMELWAIRG